MNDTTTLQEAFFHARSPSELALASEAVMRASLPHLVLEPPVKHPALAAPLSLVPLAGTPPARAALEDEIAGLVEMRRGLTVGGYEADIIAYVAQRLASAVHRLMAGWPEGAWSRWAWDAGEEERSCSPASEPYDFCDPSAVPTESPTSLHFTASGALLLDYGTAFVEFSYATGKILRVLPSRATRLAAVIDGFAIVEGSGVVETQVDARSSIAQANAGLREHMGIDVGDFPDDVGLDGTSLAAAFFALDLTDGSWSRASRPAWPYVAVDEDPVAGNILRREDGATAWIFQHQGTSSWVRSADLRWIAFDGTVWDTREARVVAHLDSTPGAMARTADEKLIVWQEDDCIVLDDEVILECGTAGTVGGFDVDGKRFATVDGEGVLSIWSLGESPSLLARHDVSAVSVTLSPG